MSQLMIRHYKKFLAIMFFSLGLNAQVKLTVNTIPKKVNVKLDGVILGESPIINERISPGIHKFEIIKKGFAPLNYELVVNPAQAVHLDFFCIYLASKNLHLLYQLFLKLFQITFLF